MEVIKINDLVERCVHFFHETCYTERRISSYQRLWRLGILRYMADRNERAYSPQVGEAFIKTCHCGGIVRHSDREKIRSVCVLNDMLTLGYIRKKSTKHVYHPLEGTLGMEMEKLLVNLSQRRRSPLTLDAYRLYMSRFLLHLNVNKVHHIYQIGEYHIVSFMSSTTGYKTRVLSIIRSLFDFWRKENVIDGRFDEFFDTYRVHQKERIPSFYTTQEVLIIENSISRSSAIGKRNYAITLLASRLGLRAGDIAGLTFSNLDWERDIILLKMQKTKKIIELPILTEVGNALVDYLRNGRPQSTLPKIHNVFLTCCAPYKAATSGMMTNIISGIIKKSGVSIYGRHFGPHALRHSLASAMLGNGTTMPVISETLGHKSTQTTLSYLKIDIQSLLKCALTVRPISENFYMQRGGAFYE